MCLEVRSARRQNLKLAWEDAWNHRKMNLTVKWLSHRSIGPCGMFAKQCCKSAGTASSHRSASESTCPLPQAYSRIARIYHDMLVLSVDLPIYFVITVAFSPNTPHAHSYTHAQKQLWTLNMQNCIMTVCDSTINNYRYLQAEKAGRVPIT